MEFAISQGLSTVCTAGKMCVDPAIFADLCYKADAINLGILCFVAGIVLTYAYNYIEEYLDGSN